MDLIPDLYRKEYGKMVTVLCSRFGMAYMDIAEDIVSDTFLSAAETWGMKGVPSNPVAWLYAVARNNALNYLKHDKVFEKRVRKDLIQGGERSFEMDIDLSGQNITDSQLQMLFAICHPSIPVEAQVSMALRVLCGFTIDEIAQALLTSKGNINKRLFRAKEKLRAEEVEIAFPEGGAISARLDTVLVYLYLLFNEGYYSASVDKVLRKDFCLEAMRLTYLLLGHPPTGKPKVYALMALMCFQASRFDARIDDSGELVLYEEQDTSRWDQELIDRGSHFFVQASGRGEISKYHVEAAIAWWHTHQVAEQEKWENILRLYNQLLILEYSPIAALNRAYAFFRVYGKEKAIVEAEGLQLTGNLFYHSLLGELYTGVDREKARQHFVQALALAGSEAERAVLEKKLSNN
ncbi:sigma-70 family RNA polymerase sigma factor [Flavitalea sp. BT771]|uniref:RNA polymerase sigma factor n=1 Tax=Flavitalea sp. BT771 TaxID=3063329 RepID=UPI0026E21355|nr:sigma-70 family RNA polymerase sigma factor [Flavitalea sp. BT771]MDO6431723.1 sigma-70 family RNA polymerase sigma factor [Flavitalea sp. BT771]MDV6220631.1 sigma-70 family RNA polymerase sigma factor [Flavitalea sp. BT771]